MRLRAEARSRWRAWLGLALLIGLAGGAATAAAAGARRTETAYPRFVQAQNGYDLFIRGFPESQSGAGAGPDSGAARSRAVGPHRHRRPASAILPSGRLVLGPELVATADLTGRAGVGLNRFKVISGRMQTLAYPVRRSIDFPTADREDLRVGSVVRFSLGNPAAPRKFAAVRIVGIVASPGQFPGCRCLVGVRQDLRDASVRPVERHQASAGRCLAADQAPPRCRRPRRVPPSPARRGPERASTSPSCSRPRPPGSSDRSGWNPRRCGFSLRPHSAGRARHPGAGTGAANLPGLRPISPPSAALGMSRAPVGLAGDRAGRGHRRGCRLRGRPGSRAALAAHPDRPGQDRRARPRIRRWTPCRSFLARSQSPS